MNCYFRILRFLVRGVNPGEVLYLTRSSAFVKALRITALAHLQRSGDVDLDKIDVITEDNLPRSTSIQAIRRNQRGDNNQPRIRHQLRDFRNTANVLHAIDRRKSKIGVQSVANVVAIQNKDLHVTIEQIRFKTSGQGRLART